MPTIHLRVSHYEASYLYNASHEFRIPPDQPIRIDAGNPMLMHIVRDAYPNLSNVVNIECFSDIQWRHMMRGKYLVNTGGMLMMDNERDPSEPLSVDEVYRYAGRTDLLKKDDYYTKVYIPILLPKTIFRHGKEVQTQSDWFLPDARNLQRAIRERYLDAMLSFVDTDQREISSENELRRKRGLIPIVRPRSASIDRFLIECDIRIDDRVREQQKRLDIRHRQRLHRDLDQSDTHGLSTDELANADTPQRHVQVQRNRGKGRPVRCLNDDTIYPSCGKAARAYGIKDRQLIARCALSYGQFSTAGGLKFAYLD